jgi:hypothetical protein
MPQEFDELPFENEHIVAVQHDGKTVRNNLALACFACNRRKGPNLSGVDPVTRKLTRLFHPRRHKWESHFHWQGPVLHGKTPIGRTSIAVLGINQEHRVRHRAQLMAEGLFPSK